MDDLDRIDSWKQIAAYMAKSERTVRRWQQVEGLPVHRHVHQQRGSVWAYKKELDEWLASRKESPELLADAPEPAAAGGRSRILLLGGAFALGAALAVVLWPGRRPADSRVFEPETLTALPGTAFGPALSPDAKRVAFYWNSGGPDAGVYIKVIGSETQTPLVLDKGGEFVYGPAWSPDGKTIGFLRRARSPRFSPTSETWLCLIDAAGGPQRRLIRLAKDVLFYANWAHLSWSRDGQWILAPMADGERRGIHWIPVGTGEPRRLTNPGEGRHHLAPALAPDGQSFVYIRQTGPLKTAIEEVVRHDLTENGTPAAVPRVLYRGRTVSSGLAWMPSSRELILCKADNALSIVPFNSRLFRLAADSTGDPVPLGLGPCTTPAVSRPNSSGGALLVYGSGDQYQSRLFRAALDTLDRPKEFAPSSRFDGIASHSPDGSLVAFVSNRSGNPEVWVASRDGTGTKRLTENSKVASPPRWSPDGSRLVYAAATTPGKTGERESPHRMFIAPLAGGSPTLVPLDTQPVADPVWAEDGHLRFWSGQQLWRVRPDGSGAAKLGEYPARLVRGATAVGLNDRYVMYARVGTPFTLCRELIGTGKEEVLAEGLQTAFFAVSRKFAYFIKGAGTSLHATPLAGGPTRRVGELPEQAEPLLGGWSIAPDDSSIVFATRARERWDLMLVRDFR